jgi:hypothetical protein
LGSDISCLTKLIKSAVPGGTTIIDTRANRLAELCSERASRGDGQISEASPAEQKAPEAHDTVTLVRPKIANAWFSGHSVKSQPRDNKMLAKTTHVRRALARGLEELFARDLHGGRSGNHGRRLAHRAAAD